jgi:hypothetical protein
VPPDDDLFPAVEGTAAPATPGNGAAPTTEGDKPLSAKDVADLVKQFVEPNTEQMGRITRNQTDLAQNLNEMRGVLERLGITGDRSERSDDVFDPSTLLTDPNAVSRIVQAEIGRALKEQVAPILSQQITTVHRDTVARLKGDIDSTYGEGVWAKEFAPELDPIFERTRRDAPDRLGDVDAIEKAVNAVKGMKFDTLTEAKGKADEAKAASIEARRKEGMEYVTSNLSGGIGVPTTKSTLPQEGKDYLDRIMRATGTRPDEAEFLRSLNSGSTLADWQAAHKKTGA